jgi:hypothetical protein
MREDIAWFTVMILGAVIAVVSAIQIVLSILGHH